MANPKPLKATSTNGIGTQQFQSGDFIGKDIGGTGVDLSSSGGSNQFLAQDASHNISSRAIAAGDLPTGIDATNIGSGVVSNTEFGYLDGVTSGIQAQINAANFNPLLYVGLVW